MMFLVGCLLVVGLSSHGAETVTGAKKDADAKHLETINIFKKVVEERGFEFLELEEVTQQVVSGFIFEGICKVVDNNETVRYRIKVWVKAGGVSREVLTFEKLE